MEKQLTLMLIHFSDMDLGRTEQFLCPSFCDLGDPLATDIFHHQTSVQILNIARIPVKLTLIVSYHYRQFYQQTQRFLWTYVDRKPLKKKTEAAKGEKKCVINGTYER